MPKSDYRTAVERALVDWDAPPYKIKQFSCFRNKSVTSIAAARHIRQIMRDSPTYDDELVRVIRWLIRTTLVRRPLRQLDTGSRLYSVLTEHLSAEPQNEPQSNRLEELLLTTETDALRFSRFKRKTTTALLYASHAMWDRKALKSQGQKEMVTVSYNFDFYCQPGEPLTGTEYRRIMPGLAANKNRSSIAKDSFTSGATYQNLVLIGLERDLLKFTEDNWKENVLAAGCDDLSLLTYKGEDKAMTLEIFDTWLSNAKWPTQVPIGMVVCRVG